MAKLIDNLLGYARIGRIGLTAAEIDLSALAAKIGEQLSETKPGVLTVQPELHVEGDPDLIEMVLFNLLENAWKYVPPGGGPEVEVGKTPEGVFVVRDKGIGFDMKYVDKVWEPFERLHLESEYPGTGIGLANSRRIVERHGGQMWTESAPGQGATMFFTLGAPTPLQIKADERVRNEM
jgi:signal transduction histidine kinase